MKKVFYTFFCALAVFGAANLYVPAAHATYGDVATYAGSVYGGDGGDKLDAYFDFPEDLALDTSGNYYIADTYNNVIRKISSGGTVSTLAGGGSYGSADGASTAAQFALPRGVAAGSDGAVYVADTGNSRIRKVAADGTVSTLVSSGVSSPYGVRPYGTRLYIADSGNGAIKYVSTSGGTVTTLTSSLSDPRRMDISDDGQTLYVADNGNHRVVSVNTTTGVVNVIAGSGNSGYVEGIGTLAQFENVWGIALDGGYLYVSDHDGWTVDRIRKINLATRSTSLVYQDTRQNEMIYPSGVLVNGDYVYTVNAGLGTVHRFNKNNGSDNSLFAGSDRFGNENGDIDGALFGRPNDMAMTADGKYLYVADNNKIRKIDTSAGTVSHVIGSSVDNYRGEGTDYDELPVRFSTIQGITVNAAGTRLYIADRWNNRIRGVNLTADPISTFLVSGAGLINTRGDDNNGYLEGTRCSEDIQTTGASGCSYFRAPTGIVIDPTNTYLYVSDTGNNRIRKVRISDGQTWLVAGSGEAGYLNGIGSSARFNRPFGLTIDATGSNLYVADTNNHVIRKIELSSGTVSTVVGNGSAGYREAIGTDAVLSYPEYVKMSADNQLYFSDTGSQRVRVVDPSTRLTKLVAGSGTRGYKNGAKESAQFNNIKGLQPSADSTLLYVADMWNDAIRRVDVEGEAPYSEPAPTLSAISPSEVNPAWDKGAGLHVKVEGGNFQHGLITLFGNAEAEITYVQSATSLSVRLPLTKMNPGWYDVTVRSLDGQEATLERSLGITNSAGVTPDVYYEYSGKTAGTISSPGSYSPPIAEGTSFFAYSSSLRGGYHTGAGNLLGSNDEEIIVGSGDGMAPHVRVFDSTGTLKAQFFAYDSSLRNGVIVSACDVNGDGMEEVVTAQGPGGWPLVRIFDGYGTVVNDGFYVLDGKYTGGVNLSCGDTNGDGISEIVVAAQAGGGPHVLVYNVDGKILTNFMAYDPKFRGGINVTTADADGDGKDEIITGPQIGASHVQFFQIRPNELKRLSPGFYAFNLDYRGGVSVAGVDTDGDGTKEVLVGVGEEASPLVRVFNIHEELQKEFYVYTTTYLGGVNIAGGDVDGDGADELMTVPRSGGGPNVRVINVDEV
ncbi:MAG: FG-GAP-like repeat-containing protein [Patescibacteria group bacterium]